MKKIFAKKATQPLGAGAGRTDRLASAIVRWCLERQAQWARWMEARAGRLSLRATRNLCIGFCIAGGGVSLWLVAANFLVPPERPIVSVTPLRQPRLSADSVTAHRYPLATPPEYERIRQFRLYMDSLAVSATGRPRFDSITAARPLLLDSIGHFLQLYEQQNKR